jgi:LuxR family transcriptional regulator, maltose regulon positive regulatory protein
VSPTVRSGRRADPELRSADGGIVSRPELVDRLQRARRVTQLSASPGSGKTTLVQSWIRESGIADRAAWVSVYGERRQPQPFWISVSDALRGTAPGSKVLGMLTAAPDLSGWTIVERLVGDLGQLEEDVWLVIDDLHELASDDGLRQVELFILRAPQTLRLVLLTRHDLRIGLHRVRLAGDLTEIRAADLRFTPAEARMLFQSAGVELSDRALDQLVDRTEGWAAGLRLAALSLRGHVDPARFASEFSGTERTVSEYLLAEVLDRQPDDVRRLLLRMSILERVNGALADILTGGSGSERILHELEDANAFVTAIDAQRTWFRCHRLFADLLELELRRTEPGEMPALHAAAADWLVRNGHPLEAIRHAQAAEEWDMAALTLFDEWLELYFLGQGATAHQLLSRFPASVPGAAPELATMRAVDDFDQGLLDEAAAQLKLAVEGVTAVPQDRRAKVQAYLSMMQMLLARRRGNYPVVIEESSRLLDLVGPNPPTFLSQGIRVVALFSAGVAEIWSNRHQEADQHLEEAVALAQRIDSPYLEVIALGHWGLLAALSSLPLALERFRRAIDLAEAHGWTEASVMPMAYVGLAYALIWAGEVEEAERWLERAQRVHERDREVTTALVEELARGFVATLRGRNDAAIPAFRAVERYSESVVTEHTVSARGRSLVLNALLTAGKTEEVEKGLAELDAAIRNTGDIRVVAAALRMAQKDPERAQLEVAPIIDGSAPMTWAIWSISALLLDAVARDSLQDFEGAHRALELALEMADPKAALLPFLLYPAPELLRRHARSHTSHGPLISKILNFQGQRQRLAARDSEGLAEPLSEGERRILRYLPTNLSVREIADQTYLSPNTVKTHMRHVFAKLDAHRRSEAVERARELGLIAPSALRSTRYTQSAR